MLTRRSLVGTAIAGSSILSMPSILRATPLKSVRIGYDVPNFDLLREPSKLASVAAGNLCGMSLDPLVRLAGENQLEWVLATSIYNDISGTKWYIELNENARWNLRQTPVTLEQVAANIRYWQEDTKSSLGEEFRAYVQSVTVESNYDAGRGRIRVNLNRPNFQFLFVFTTYSALIMHPDDRWSFDEKTDGTGPFRLTAYASHQEATFTPAANSWNVKERAQTPVTFFHTDGQTDLNFDLVPLQGPGQEEAAKRKGLTIKQNALGDTLVIHMNCRSGPLADNQLRQALRFCMNPKEMLKGISDLGREADHTHATPIHFDYPSSWKPQNTYDPVKSRGIIGERQMELPLYFMANNIWQQTLSEIYAQQAKSVGVDIKLMPVTRAEFDANWKSFPGLTMIKWNHRPLAMQLYRTVYLSSADWNLSGWTDPEFDALVEQLYATPITDKDKLNRLMSRAMEILQSRGPMIQAAWVDCNKAYNPERLVASSVQVGAGGYIYANRLRNI